MKFKSKEQGSTFFGGRAKPWLELCRLPNLFTIPGDILAGNALVCGASNFDKISVMGTIVLSLFLYVSGLFLNDWCDQKVDKKERPNRPLPSGEISANSVLLVSISGFAVALAIAFSISTSTFLVTSILTALIVLYNCYTKNIQGIGLLTMASCRATNLLLGVSIVGFRTTNLYAIGVGAGLVFYYIFVLSYLARMEMTQLPSNVAKGLVKITPILALLHAASNHSGMTNWIGFAVSWSIFSANTWCIVQGIERNKDQRCMSSFIGRLIRNHIFLQSIILACGGASFFWILVLILHWPIAAYLGNRFYGS